MRVSNKDCHAARAAARNDPFSPLRRTNGDNFLDSGFTPLESVLLSNGAHSSSSICGKVVGGIKFPVHFALLEKMRPSTKKESV